MVGGHGRLAQKDPYFPCGTDRLLMCSHLKEIPHLMYETNINPKTPEGTRELSDTRDLSGPGCVAKSPWRTTVAAVSLTRSPCHTHDSGGYVAADA